MPALTYDRIKIHGAFGLSILHDLELHVQPNEHAQVKFSGIVDYETGFTEIQKQIEGRQVTIEIQEDNKKPPPCSAALPKKSCSPEKEKSTISKEHSFPAPHS